MTITDLTHDQAYEIISKLIQGFPGETLVFESIPDLSFTLSQTYRPIALQQYLRFRPTLKDLDDE